MNELYEQYDDQLQYGVLGAFFFGAACTILFLTYIDKDMDCCQCCLLPRAEISVYDPDNQNIELVFRDGKVEEVTDNDKEIMELEDNRPTDMRDNEDVNEYIQEAVEKEVKVVVEEELKDVERGRSIQVKEDENKDMEVKDLEAGEDEVQDVVVGVTK